MHKKRNNAIEKDIPSKNSSEKRLEPAEVQDAGEEESEFFSDVNKFLHEPIRLQIMLHLVHLGKTDMIFLKKALGLTWGNLSFHISKLEEKGYVIVEKQFVGKKPLSLIAATPEGILKFKEYRKAIIKFLNP